MIDILPMLMVVIKVIKYWKKIKIPEILIESKRPVENEIIKMLDKGISLSFNIFIKILNEVYVQSIQANKNGISLGL